MKARKKSLTIGLTPDVMEMLREQTNDINISNSAYIERLILKADWENKAKKKEMHNE